MARIHQVVQARGGITLVDEIYLPLSYDAHFGQSALALDQSVISINSFSKYFNMTGWRLGWMVLPSALVPVIERLAQNLFICPSAIAQHAALACFEDASIALYESRRQAFAERRDYFVPALNALGLNVPVMPDGAFYAWADCSQACARLGIKDSWDFSFAAMERAHVAITPGRDFGQSQTGQFVRFSTASSMEQLHMAIERMGQMLTA
jgi:aspartate/methionine/tyrosine aminotransferase